MNLALTDVAGAMLVVSQSLVWAMPKGRRPSFSGPRPRLAKRLYETLSPPSAARHPSRHG